MVTRSSASQADERRRAFRTMGRKYIRAPGSFDSRAVHSSLEPRSKETREDVSGHRSRDGGSMGRRSLMGDTLIDLTGRRFGSWTVIERAPNRGKAVRWLCRCERCERIVDVAGTSLKSGISQMCRPCSVHENHYKTHGLSKHPLHGVWQRMKGCTSSPTHHDFKHYGGRGIRVCDEWFHDFKAFYDWAMANGYKPGLTIERIDVNGNYEPSNCTWIPRELQPLNQRRTKRGDHV